MVQKCPMPSRATCPINHFVAVQILFLANQDVLASSVAKVSGSTGSCFLQWRIWNTRVISVLGNVRKYIYTSYICWNEFSTAKVKTSICPPHNHIYLLFQFGIQCKLAFHAVANQLRLLNHTLRQSFTPVHSIHQAAKSVTDLDLDTFDIFLHFDILQYSTWNNACFNSQFILDNCWSAYRSWLEQDETCTQWIIGLRSYTYPISKKPMNRANSYGTFMCMEDGIYVYDISHIYSILHTSSTHISLMPGFLLIRHE